MRLLFRRWSGQASLSLLHMLERQRIFTLKLGAVHIQGAQIKCHRPSI